MRWKCDLFIFVIRTLFGKPEFRFISNGKKTTVPWNMGYYRYDEIFMIPEKREYIFRKTMEFLLNNDIFDDEGRIRNQLTEEEIQKMKMSQFTASKEYYESMGLDNKNMTNFNEFLDKYKIDKSRMREHLLIERQEIDFALNQIDNPTSTS